VWRRAEKKRLQCGSGEDVSSPDVGDEQKGEKEPKGGIAVMVNRSDR
jgi:hypothetical protein